jgi:uncharacterized membrane protein
MTRLSPRIFYRFYFYRPLRALAASSLVGALASDVAYWWTADFVWADFSDWLVSAAVIVGFFALIVGVVEALALRQAGGAKFSLLYAVLNLVAWVLAVLDMFVHTRDSWTSVAPWGLALSLLSVLAVFASTWWRHAAPAPTISEKLA